MSSGQGANDVVELLGAQGHRTLGFYLRLVVGGQTDLEVSGGDRKAVLSIRAQQRVGQDGHGRLLLDDALHSLQCFHQFRDADAQLHAQVLRYSILYK